MSWITYSSLQPLAIRSYTQQVFIKSNKHCYTAFQLNFIGLINIFSFWKTYTYITSLFNHPSSILTYFVIPPLVPLLYFITLLLLHWFQQSHGVFGYTHLKLKRWTLWWNFSAQRHKYFAYFSSFNNYKPIWSFSVITVSDNSELAYAKNL